MLGLILIQFKEHCGLPIQNKLCIAGYLREFFKEKMAQNVIFTLLYIFGILLFIYLFKTQYSYYFLLFFSFCFICRNVFLINIQFSQLLLLYIWIQFGWVFRTYVLVREVRGLIPQEAARFFSKVASSFCFKLVINDQTV